MNEVATHELKPKLRSSVAATVDRLQQGVLGRGGPVPQSEARRILATLRQHSSTPIDKDPLSLERSLSILAFPLATFEYGKGDLPSPSERAAHLALSFSPFTYSPHASRCIWRNSHSPRRAACSSHDRTPNRSSRVSMPWSSPRIQLLGSSTCAPSSHCYAVKSLVSITEVSPPIFVPWKDPIEETVF